MKVLYLDLGMGAAGDMLSAALLELFPKEERAEIVAKLNALGIPKVVYEAEPSVKCGISGTHMSVKVDGAEETSEDVHEHTHEHEHSHDHEHEHTHEHDHEHEHHHDHEHHHEHDHCHGEAEHEHLHDEAHDEHEHTHVHDEEHGHTHGQGDDHADHGHEHAHGGHTHSHNNMAGIAHIVNDHMELGESVKQDVLAVYGLIAEAESHSHGVDVSEIHFHEVGNMDAVADVAAVSYMLSLLKPDRIIVSPVNTGSGQVRCAHGIMPVPAPATAYLLKGVPSYDNGIKGELLTPTGAALVRHFADSFGKRPAMTIDSIGYGMGRKDFEAANCVRAIMGEINDVQAEHADKLEASELPEAESGKELKHNYDEALTGTVVELAANIDDMSAEELGYAFERLLAEGALDVWTESALMKKNRPGAVLKLLCREGAKDAMVSALFRYTSTIGVRESLMKRYTLKREIHEYDTSLGKIRSKHVSGYGVEREKLEYDDIAAIAKEREISIASARRLAEEEIKKKRI